ncbi:hypothetical protein D3C77_207040 [compost metagenome]
MAEPSTGTLVLTETAYLIEATNLLSASDFIRLAWSGTDYFEEESGVTTGEVTQKSRT